ncbi:MAG: transglycosylase SLT domain-containing protein [Pseudomonadota bacterium]
MCFSRLLLIAFGALGTAVLPLSVLAQADATAPQPVSEQSQVETTASGASSASDPVRPRLRTASVSATRWTAQPGHMVWNRAALSALKTHAAALVEEVPSDIGSWCPLYPQATSAQRRAFWLGFMSTLAKYESTYNPRAVGGGGKWYGLLQILPATARGYGCNARSGTALKNGAANLSCAARIMAVTVPRDGVIYAPGGRGVAADWGPMRSRAKRADMAGWLRRQSYCMPASTARPVARPVRVAVD